MTPRSSNALAAALCSLTLAAGCRKDPDDRGEESVRAWDLVNTADATTFGLRLSEMRRLTEAATRAGLPVGETRVGGAQSECADDAQVFGLAGMGPAGGGFALADGQSCGDAVRMIKSFYAQALDAAGLAVDRLASVRPGGVLCGFRSDAQPVGQELAAVAYALAPIDQPAGSTFEQTLWGGADLERVGVLSTSRASCVKDVGDCGGGPSMRLDATAKLFANLDTNALDYQNVLVHQAPATEAGATHDVITEVRSNLAITGLGAGERLKMHEDASYAVTPQVPGASTARVALSMDLDEVSAGRLRLTGRVVADGVGSEPARPEEFAFELRRQGELCRVALGAGPAPSTPFDPVTLPGTWARGCVATGLGRLGERFSEESVRFGADGALTHTLLAFDDQECFSGHEAARIVIQGEYKVGGELAPDADGATEIALNLGRRDVEVTLVSADLVARFNEARLCDRDDWAVGLPKRFDVGRCFFDLGDGALMNALTLKRATEYVSILPEPPHVVRLARSVDLAGLSEERRARVGEDGVALGRQ